MRASERMASSLVAIGLAGCVSQQAEPIDPAVYSLARAYIGKTYKLNANAEILCQTPDLPINQVDRCAVTSDGGGVTVIDVVANGSGIFPKVRLANGKEGYILENELLLMETQSLPSPRVGMTKNEALQTNWGSPDQKNVTETPGHRVEQWVFPVLGYLYIADGVLTSIQRSE